MSDPIPPDSDDGADDPGAHRLGLPLTLAGGAIALLWMLDRIAPLPLPMPIAWHQYRAVWGGLGLAAALFGLWIQRDRQAIGPPGSGPPRGGWRPRLPGLRFHRVVVYSRPGCHLCDDAKELLADYHEFLPEVEEIDIDGDEELKARYGLLIPVIEFDGRERFRGRIDEGLLRRLIDATMPL